MLQLTYVDPSADDPPIACTLSAAEFPKRLAEMYAIGRSSLLEAHDGEAPAELRFRPDPGTRERLEAIVAAESNCCAFLALRLRETAHALTLTISGPELARPLVADMVDAFRGSSRS